MAKRSVDRHLDSARLTQPAAEIVALRESSIYSLAAHGVLSAGQIAAALAFREAWERHCAIARPQLSFERVDHARGKPYAETGNDAEAALRRYRAALGTHGFQLLIKVCGEGWHIRDLYQTRRERDTAADMLGVYLELIGG